MTDLAAIRKHQTALSADLKDLQTSNNALWQEAIQSRERHTKHQETINKILRFLATVFGGQVTAEGESPAAANVVDEEEQKGEGKGKAKGKEVPSAVLPKMRSRLLLEDVKGRKEARDKKRREEEEMDEDEDDDADSIEEIPLLRDDSDDLPTISSGASNSARGLEEVLTPIHFCSFALLSTHHGSLSLEQQRLCLPQQHLGFKD